MAAEGDNSDVLAVANTGKPELEAQSLGPQISSVSADNETEKLQGEKRKHDNQNEVAGNKHERDGGNSNDPRAAKRHRRAGFGAKRNDRRERGKELDRGEY